MHSRKKYFIGAIIILCIIIFVLLIVLIITNIIDETEEGYIFYNETFLTESKILDLELKINKLNKEKEKSDFIIEENHKTIESLNRKINILIKEIFILFESIRKKMN